MKREACKQAKKTRSYIIPALRRGPKTQKENTALCCCCGASRSLCFVLRCYAIIVRWAVSALLLAGYLPHSPSIASRTRTLAVAILVCLIIVHYG